LRYEGAEAALSEAQRVALGAELDSHLYMTTKAVCAFVERSVNVVYLSRLLALF